MKEERLFAAIGGADPKLLERSEKQRHFKPWMGWGLAACMAVVLGVTLLPRPEPGISTVLPESDREETKISSAAVLQFDGGEVGTLQLCRIQYGPAALPDFALYVNEEIYTTAEEDGTYVIRPLDTLPAEEFPPIDLTISHLTGVSPAQAAEETAAALAAVYAQIRPVEEGEAGFYFRAEDGNAWDDAQAEVTCVDDRQGGTYLLTARYFLEAEEGHGARFRDMVGTFQVTTSDEELAAPLWMQTLQDAADRLTTAVFAADLAAVEDLLAEDALLESVDRGDVSGEVSVAAIELTPDDDQAPTSAVVSVKHRISMEDGFDYLTMELTYTDGRWQLIRAGLEK